MNSIVSVVTLACGVALVAACASSPPPSTPPASPPAAAVAAHVPSVHDFEEKSIDHQTVRLDTYAGKVLLIVNVASRCGFTPQYEGLEALYQKHKGEGLVLLGFPCDQFGNQEPGTEEEIKSFCSMKYAVTFPLFSKVEVNGPNANPLYRFLRAEQKGSFTKDTPGAEKLYAHLEKSMPEVLGTDAVKWNFTKFLVDRKGHVVTRFESAETPAAIEAKVVELLAAH